MKCIYEPCDKEQQDKKKYQAPVIKVVFFDNADIITSSEIVGEFDDWE